MPANYRLAIGPIALLRRDSIDGISGERRGGEEKHGERILVNNFPTTYVGCPQLGFHAPEIILGGCNNWMCRLLDATTLKLSNF
jgi:hypothetical protein